MGGQAKAGILKSSTSNVDVAASRSAIELEPSTVFALTAIAAAILYLFRLGAAPLGASEAYSAWAAAMPSPWAIIHIPVPLDPGKQVFYYILLHYFTAVFGMSEVSLRTLSPLFALATLPILFVLARTMFDDSIAASAVVLWAFNPVILLLSRRARMYPMLAAVALAHFMLLWQVRRKPAWPLAAACGFFGALAIYTHLAALFLLGAEAAMLVRDFIHGRRNPMAWLALAIAVVLFLPYFPIFSTQSDQMVHGHWLDWISTGYHLSLATKVLIALVAGAISLAIVFGPKNETDPDEPLRWCLAWGLLPVIAFLFGTAIIRPMFHIRYLIPCVAMIALILARVFESFGSKIRNLAVVGITLTLLILAPLKEITNEPWRDIAALVSAQSPPAQPIFFESGFLFFDGPDGEPNNGFPTGYYRNAFDFYFRGNNPRVAIPGWDSAAAKAVMTDRIAQSGGGWLVSWKSANDARVELPDGFKATQLVEHHLVALYRIEPAPR
ncbi:MAG TPA: glycosyltransferase family 39 protein [Candidatus Binataceae bacterium]|nr:glycosyltransferase family 39 protein [Candidatus Binataceae bacterium]